MHNITQPSKDLSLNLNCWYAPIYCGIMYTVGEEGAVQKGEMCTVGDWRGRDVYSWPLHCVPYVLLTPVFWVLHTHGPCTLYVMHSSPLFSALHISDHCILWVAHPWPLHFVHYVHLNPAHCVFCTPGPWILCVMYCCPLHSVHYSLSPCPCSLHIDDSSRCALSTPELFTLPVTYSWPLHYLT